MKIGEKVYTPEEASELLGGVLSARTLRDRATKGLYPHLGGRRACGPSGNLRFAESHLQHIADTLERVPEISDSEVFKANLSAMTAFTDRLTGRSKAAHR